MPRGLRVGHTPSPVDWEEARPLIAKLYIQENKPLCEVQRVLAESCGFKASLRTYKTKLKTLGIRKNFSLKQGKPNQDETRIASAQGTEAPCSDEPQQHQTTSAPCVAASTVASPEVIGCSRRLARGSIMGPNSLQLELRSVQCLPSLSLNASLNGPGEPILLAARSFVTGANDEQKALSIGTKPDDEAEKRPFRRRKQYLWNHFQHGLTMLDKGRCDQAFESFQKGCDDASKSIAKPPQAFIMSLLMVMGNYRWKGHQALFRGLLRFLASLSSINLGKHHPLTFVLFNLQNRHIMTSMAEPLLKIMLDLLQATLGPTHPTVLLTKQSLSVQLMRQGEHDSSEALISEACKRSAEQHGHGSLMARNCLRRLANLYCEQKRWDEAAAVFEDVIARDTQISGSSPTHETSVFTCQNLSMINHQKGDKTKSEYWADQELELALKIYGPTDDYYLDCCSRREARHQGKPASQWFSWLEIS